MKIYQFKIFVHKAFLVPICHRTFFLSKVYYFLFSNDFARENNKVLKGKYEHLQALKNHKPNAFHLRRQIHRLEKGLIMKEKRSVFALDYIIDTVNNYKILLNSDLFFGNQAPNDKDLLVWASDVIQKYFDTVDSHEIVLKAKEIFFSLNHNIESELHTQLSIPYYRRENNSSDVTYESLKALAIQRRSVRWYQNRTVDRSLIEKAVEVASLSPSACNRQPFEFRIFDQVEIKNKVGAIPMGIRPFYNDIPVFVVLVGKLSAYLSERDRHVIYIDGGLAAMSFMLALETLGLSSVPINWPDIEEFEEEMEKTISLDPDERPIMLIGLGYADPEGMIPFSQKKSPSVLIKYN